MQKLSLRETLQYAAQVAGIEIEIPAQVRRRQALAMRKFIENSHFRQGESAFQ